jgi:hypothetical protein
MANRLNTIFQNLDKAISGNWNNNKSNPTPDVSSTPDLYIPSQATTSNILPTVPSYHNNSYNLSDKVLYKTDDKAKFDKKKLEYEQAMYLAQGWKKANQDLSMNAIAGLNNLQLMYRDCELMDSRPEISAALDLFSEEACGLNSAHQMINVYSKSDRVKSILEDLFVNRLSINITGPMIIRALAKYGNQYMLHNIDKDNGVIGWRQLPVSQMQRIENGILNPFGSQNPQSMKGDDMSTKFVWVGGQNHQEPFRNWQVSHFRLLTNSLYLPYGMSMLSGIRRHFRLLSLMEDMMLIYRLDKSMERRVFKIFVGAIDEKDVPAYIEQIANQFKRTELVDPLTGQLDLRKNLLGISDDFFLPVRDPNQASPIETLAGAQNLTAIDDINYIHNQLLAGLRVPKPFINFENEVGAGKNLSLLDVRFTRVINRLQQAFLMELTKVAITHLYILGFEDEISNFELVMESSSDMQEQIQIENKAKKIAAVRDAVTDPGNGIPIMSLQRALKEVMGWSDKDVEENLQEIRLERALVSELEKTPQIIKRTGIFDPTDNTYGESGAEYQEGDMGGEGDGGDFGGGGMGGSSFGGGLDDLGGVEDENMEGDLSGEEGTIPTDQMGGMEEPAGGGNEIPAAAPQGGGQPAQESKSKSEKRVILEINEGVSVGNKTFKTGNDILETFSKKINEQNEQRKPDLLNTNFMINEEFDSMMKDLKLKF